MKSTGAVRRTQDSSRRWTGDLRLLPAAVTAWVGAALAVQASAVVATAAGLAVAACAFVLVTVVLVVPGRTTANWRTANSAPLAVQGLAPLAAGMLVLLSAGGSLARAEAGPVDHAMRNSSTFTAVLRMTGEPSVLPPSGFSQEENILVDADIVGGVLGGSRFASTTPVVVIASMAWADVGWGDTVRVLGTVEPSDRVGRARAVFLPSAKPAIRDAGGWLGYSDGLRNSFRETSERAGRDRGLLPGMALGDRSPLDPDLEEAMKLTGLTHLTAVSGANCSYVVAFAFIGLRSLRLPRAAAAGGAVAALTCFVLLVRPEPSVLRAAVMGGIGVLAILSGRGKVSVTVLLLSIIVLLAMDPWLSVSFAFQLSVAATLGLVVAGPAMVVSLARVLPLRVAQLLAIPLTAQVFCTPIIVLIQPSLPVYALPANVAAAPVVPAVTLLGMAAVLALATAPVLAVPLVVAAQAGTRWVGGVADALARAPAASLPWLEGVPGAVLAALFSLTVLAALLLRVPRISASADAPRARGTGTMGDRNQDTASGGPGSRSPELHPRKPRAAAAAPRGRRPQAWTQDAKQDWKYDGKHDRRHDRRHDRKPGWTRPTAVVLTVMLLVFVAAVTVLVRGLLPTPPPGGIITVCDVGQGDGLVLGTAPGHALVVDTGPDPDAMDRCLDAVSVEVIDALVITHLHDDHYGGIEGAVRGRSVSALYYSTGEDGLPDEVTEAAHAAGVEAERLSPSTVFDLQHVEARVLWPQGPADTTEENNASAVLDVVVQTPDRDVRLLLTGDLEEDATDRLLAATPELAGGGVDILKVAHHGARNGGSAVIETVTPRLAVISVGQGNDYGHPHPAILQALTTAGVVVVRTDEIGSFTVGVSGNRLEVRQLR
ncbi:ComEC/Rec2 family competence protein [Arthrobacter agilis]|uniref:ComEC/Rec2 family competence protein n=1 Tax=Arthrobacter agilis TaxID=37921 RepID=UPI002366BA3F|nr:ComEC/Rec2 family competence protein [Arthrobacter agilis]WDF31902.1 ComEC/Rec2 family competence protein [Arthrobacter agilis]